MRVVCMSDTHGYEEELEVPYGDLLLHAGDFTFLQNRPTPSTLRKFNEWLGELPHRYKVVIPGNHEYLLEEPKNRALITNATLLIDSGVEIEGVRIWGSPVTTLYGAFLMADAANRKKHWSLIPKGAEILLTHGPAYGILDGQNGGDPELLEAIQRVKPQLHVCGHVHSEYGMLRAGHTLHVNAALFDETLGGLEKNAIVVDIEELRKRIR